jgi:hypothetical protein
MGSVSAEAACENMHKAFPRKRGGRDGWGDSDLAPRPCRRSEECVLPEHSPGKLAFIAKSSQSATGRCHSGVPAKREAVRSVTERDARRPPVTPNHDPPGTPTPRT